MSTQTAPTASLTEYRCTRPDCYTLPGCPGHTDVTARQGHYVNAYSEADAHRVMRSRFPKDSHFDVQEWGTPPPWAEPDPF